MKAFTKIVFLLLVGLVLFLPVIEHFDFWDNWPATGQDLELTELAILLSLGFVLSVRTVHRLALILPTVLCESLPFAAPKHLNLLIMLSRPERPPLLPAYPALIPLRI